MNVRQGHLMQKSVTQKPKQPPYTCPPQPIMGPSNPTREAENPDILAPPEKDHGMLPNLKWSFADMRVVRGISQSLCIVLLLLVCGTLSAQNENHRVRNIVLVHGAWADGSGWKGVYDILVTDG